MQGILRLLFSSCLLVACTSAHAAEEPSPLSQGSHDVAIGEIRLHYVVEGHGPVVFVASPGWGSGMGYLRRGLAPLEAHLTLVHMDMRGSGASTRPADRTHMSQSVMADDIEGLRSFLGLERPLFSRSLAVLR